MAEDTHISRYPGLFLFCADYKCNAGTGFTDRICPVEHIPYAGAPCSDAAGVERNYVDCIALLQNSLTGRRWDPDTQTPWFNYYSSQDGRVHQVWYDDIESLSIKYQIVSDLGLGGIGMWAANFLDYSNTTDAGREQTQAMWAAIEDAAQPTPEKKRNTQQVRVSEQ
jgi:di-N-acetylchitobiase